MTGEGGVYYFFIISPPACVPLTIFSPFQVSASHGGDVTKLITQINFPSVAIQKFSLRSIKMSG